jgi:transposase
MVDGTLGSHRKDGTTKMGKYSIKTAGIDTGKRRLDVALAAGGACRQVDNDEAGHEALVLWLREHGVRRIGIEASGGYERGVVAHLRARDFTVIVFQPIQVRAYATYRLRRAKNDRIDAALIAACAAMAEKPRQAPDPRFEAFGEHLTLIEQIEEDIVRCKTRLEGMRLPRHRHRLGADLHRLKAERMAELKVLGDALRAHDDLATRLDLIRSIPGIGERTAIALVVRMPELGSLSREQAAALAGLAPFDDDSGKHNGRRHIAGGRSRLRTSLYAAALPAAFRWNKALIDLYTRLTKAGKPHKLALVACARKLLIFANTVLTRQIPWQKNNPIDNGCSG